MIDVNSRVPQPDTIAAIATPPGRGGIGVVRVSGDKAPAIAKTILGVEPRPRRAIVRPFLDACGEPIDHGVALFFVQPRSFTGENVLELHGHGGPVVMDLLLRRVIELGARLARPGEFSQRAFLNEKLDLAQAEAVADLIDSHTQQAARSALRSLQGAFSKEIEALAEALIELRGFVEAALDFPDEEIDFLADERITARLTGLQERLDTVTARARQGALLREGMTLVIAGRPNAGKSSLLNRLAGRETAIVTETPGTTRDVLRQEIQLDGLPLKIIDTAGLRETDDPIEYEGVRRAWKEIENADLILLIVDSTRGFEDQERAILEKLLKGAPVVVVWNKIDLQYPPADEHGDAIFISSKTGAGIDALVATLKARVGYEAAAEGVFTARRRHLTALRVAQQALAHAAAHAQAGELLAEELRAAQQALGEITGEFTNEDLLGKIFADFCIGK